MNLREMLEQYLTDTAEKDPAFKLSFNQRRMSRCEAFVTQKAKKHLRGKNGAVEGELIMSWAEEYFTGQKKEPRKRTWAEVKAELEAKKKPRPKPVQCPAEDAYDGQQTFDFKEEK